MNIILCMCEWVFLCNKRASYILHLLTSKQLQYFLLDPFYRTLTITAKQHILFTVCEHSNAGSYLQHKFLYKLF